MSKNKTKSVLLVGVGGQGTILASKILTAGLIEAGYDVKMSEVHGMSQRGGSVSTQVRYGEKVYSPIIGKGEADVLVSFETMEAIRCLDGLKPGGKVVVNDYKMPSLPILSGAKEYPDGIIEELKSKVPTLALDAALGIGGVPKGRIIEIYGPESSGKTTLASHFVYGYGKGGNLRCLEAGMKLAESLA